MAPKNGKLGHHLLCEDSRRTGIVRLKELGARWSLHWRCSRHRWPNKVCSASPSRSRVSLREGSCPRRNGGQDDKLRTGFGIRIEMAVQRGAAGASSGRMRRPWRVGGQGGDPSIRSRRLPWRATRCPCRRSRSGRASSRRSSHRSGPPGGSPAGARATSRCPPGHRAHAATAPGR
jgi:hypothetical protein